MGNYKNRLQFVHHDELFSTREDAMNYVNGQLIQIDRPALYAEPMILKYGDEAEPNIILAIGSVGNGETMSTNNKVFFIDLVCLIIISFSIRLKNIILLSEQISVREVDSVC